MSVYYNFFLSEYQKEANDLIDLINNPEEYKKKHFKQGKKSFLNHLSSLKSLDEIKDVIELQPLFTEYFYLVPDDIATDVIDLYNTLIYEDKFNAKDVDKYSTYRKVPLIALFYFANTYGNYYRLDQLASIRSRTSLLYNPEATDEDIKYQFLSKADAIFTFSETCKEHNADVDFIKGCIKLLNPNYDETINRIKEVSSWKNRKKTGDYIRKKYINECQKSNIDLTMEKFKSLNRSKFR